MPIVAPRRLPDHSVVKLTGFSPREGCPSPPATPPRHVRPSYEEHLRGGSLPLKGQIRAGANRADCRHDNLRRTTLYSGDAG
jgi:hypothetical protein